MATSPRIYAHRFGRDGGPDSSASALQHALQGPADGLETDVCLTADGELVLLHDPSLAIGTTATGWVNQVKWRGDLSRARLRHHDGTPSDERILRLDDLLDLAPDHLTLQFDIKVCGDPGIAAATARAVANRLKQRGADERSEVISFHSHACAAAAELGQRTRLIVWADHDLPSFIRWARRHDVHGVCVEHFLLHSALVATLAEGGLSVATCTVNDADLARRVTRLGVDAITTDVPAEIVAEVQAAAALPVRREPLLVG